jgi:hypothetical protein
MQSKKISVVSHLIRAIYRYHSKKDISLIKITPVLRIRIRDQFFLTPGSGIRIRDRKNQDPGSRISNPDHISESFVHIFWVKNTSFMTLDPG